MPYIVKSAWYPVVHLVGTGDVDLVVLTLAGRTNSVTTMDLFGPANLWSQRQAVLRGRGGLVERRDGPSWLYAMTTTTTTTTKLNTEQSTSLWDDVNS